MDPLAPKVYAEFYGLTDVGRVRKGNEDNYLIADLQNQRRAMEKKTETWRLGGRGMVFAVCDGMGGAAAGEVASQMAVDTGFDQLCSLEPGLEPQVFGEIVDRAIQQSNHLIHTMAQKDPSKKGMGTTISAAAVYGNVLFLAQVGDSRAYLLRGGTFTRVTKDQSLLEKLLEEGTISPEHAENFVGKNVILQALGPVAQVLVDLKFLELEHDDIVLLCSDGLHGQLNDAELQSILEQSETLEEAAGTLIRRANETGGPDNITAVLVRLTGDDLPKSDTPKPATPKSLRYVRAPVDVIQQKLERELGLSHWLSKYVFTGPLLVAYAVMIFLGLLYGIVSNRDSLAKLFTHSHTISKPKVGRGRLVVVSDVMSAELYIDGQIAGQLQEGGLSLSMPSGTYKVKLGTGGWTSKEQEVQLSPKHPKLIEIRRDKNKKLRKGADEKEWLPGHDSLNK